jgi:hypothetical protein
MSKNKWGLFKALHKVQHFEKDKIKFNIVLNAFAWHAYTSFVLGYVLTQLVMICMIMLDIMGSMCPRSLRFQCVAKSKASSPTF